MDGKRFQVLVAQLGDLSGVQRAGLITAPQGPKPEENIQVDVPAMLSYSPEGAVADSIPQGTRPFQLTLSLLLVSVAMILAATDSPAFFVEFR